MNWVFLDVVKTLRWTDIVSQATDWSLVPGHVIVLPLTKEAYNQVSSELTGQNLSEEVNVGHESGLQDDWDV